MAKRRKRIQVVVLGDVGRSPRMQYHAISMAKHGAEVDLIGILDSELHPEVLKSSRIHPIGVTPAPAWLRTTNRILVLLLAPLTALWQAFSLFYAMMFLTLRPDYIMIQNPPFIPTFAIGTTVSFFRRSTMVIDWHNFGHSLYALKFGPTHPLVTLHRWYEFAASRLSPASTVHFTVTQAMAMTLQRRAGITALPLHDRPPRHFQPLSAPQRAAFRAAFAPTADADRRAARVLVSSTSWTPDEDFGVLLDALVRYSALRVAGGAMGGGGGGDAAVVLPPLVAVITGKGPLKEHYLARIEQLEKEQKLADTKIHTAWLSIEDYARLLGAADLGVSLHMSSSGLDLPMKVVDMFGTGLPVVGWSRFEAWPELVTEDVNGKGFGDADELAELLVNLLGNEGEMLKPLRKGALKECNRRWDSEWDGVAGKVLGLV